MNVKAKQSREITVTRTETTLNLFAEKMVHIICTENSRNIS